MLSLRSPEGAACVVSAENSEVQIVDKVVVAECRSTYELHGFMACVGPKG
jgi:hypothetical protein